MIDLRPTHHHAIFRPSHVPAMRWPARWKYPPRIRLRLLRSWHGRQLDFKKVVCKRGFRPSSIGFRQTQLRFSPRACPWNACGLRGGSIRRAFVCASRVHGADGSLISRKLYASRVSSRLDWISANAAPIFTPRMSLECMWPARWKYPPRIRLRLSRSWCGR